MHLVTDVKPIVRRDSPTEAPNQDACTVGPHLAEGCIAATEWHPQIMATGDVEVGHVLALALPARSYETGRQLFSAVR